RDKRCLIFILSFCPVRLTLGVRLRNLTRNHMMTRTFLSETDLLGWMNAELSKHEQCDGCRFTSVLLLREEDDDGCNWSSTNLNCSGVPAAVCHPVADHVVVQAKARFNVRK
ncbi:MAG: hypothetical protein Q7J06_00430, partial [Bacteroidales bacterium]|nr:hypothetical protein [Bacteroidales bacterium]